MKQEELRYGELRPEDGPEAVRIIAHAFAGTLEATREWLEKSGTDEHRVVRYGQGLPVATLRRIPMGQFFGGRSVPLVGIAGVGVAPEVRGRGIAAHLMAEAVREIARAGVPLSGLYPATLPLYRRVGYEQAGHRFEIRLPVVQIDVRERGLRVRPLVEGDREARALCYTRFASAYNGPLDRGPYVWGRIESGRDVVYHGFGVEGEDGQLEGYLYLNQVRKPDRGRQNLTLSDVAFTTPRAGRRLLGFLREFSSMADEVVLFGGPLHPLLSLLAEHRYRLDLRDHWMLRVTEIRAALEQRGYAPYIRAELHMDVRDELIPENEGKWVLRVEGGRGHAERGGRGDLKIHVRELAAMYSSLHSARQLHALGRCEGEPEAIGAAEAIFAGTTPWMSDMY